MSEPAEKQKQEKKPAGEREIAILVRDLRVELSGQEILSGVNARFYKGEITALIGPNGAGKTTLLLSILGIIPYSGEVSFPAWPARPVFGYVPQHLEFDRGMPVTVLDFLALAHQKSPLWWARRKKTVERALKILEKVEAEQLAGRKLGGLSGGELQRVLLAEALMKDPEVILLDEPASAVDRTGEELLMTLLKRINRESGKTIVIVSHDISMVTRIADQVVCLNRVTLSEGKTAEVINTKTLAACFGSDKGLMLHEHGWEGELACAYDETSQPPGEKKAARGEDSEA